MLKEKLMEDLKNSMKEKNNIKKNGERDMKEELMSILTDLRPDVDFENEKKLIDDGVLDSFDIVSLVSELNSEFDIEINVMDLEPDNFNTVEAMLELIVKMQEE